MNTFGLTSICGVLVATSFVSGAGAVDINQPRSQATSEAPAFALPSFLDTTRLPDMQDAWRALSGEASPPATAEPMKVGAPLPTTDDAALERAREAMTRAEQVSRDAAAVRARAEELSRRFSITAEGSDAPAAPAPDPAPATTPDNPVTETASITDAALPEAAPVAPANAQQISATVGASPAGDIAPAAMPGGPRAEQEESASDPAPVVEDMATKAAPPLKRPPANIAPHRVTRTAPPAPQSPGFFASIFAGSESPEEAAASNAGEPDRDPMMPRELRSFGWNTQP